MEINPFGGVISAYEGGGMEARFDSAYCPSRKYLYH
jgi:hypothetical protein